MKKIVFLPLCLLCTGAFAAVSPPGEPTEMNWTRRPVVFSHRAHLDAAALQGDGENCGLCHHPVNDVTRHLTCATPDCHDNLNPKDMSVRSYYLATHNILKGRFNSCLACHVEQAGGDMAKMKRMVGCEESACHY
ncbi:MAG: cytochrome c3 family protein [Desulfovibrio sp.]|jgi:hypothetical protein|nr:cytochrome c3 family protein [Desulfovibrio sp.]